MGSSDEESKAEGVASIMGPSDEHTEGDHAPCTSTAVVSGVADVYTHETTA